MPDHYADDIYSDINRKKQLEDAQENKEFDRDVEAYRRGQKNLTDEERLERMKDITAKRKQLKDNLLSAITTTTDVVEDTTNFATKVIEDAKEWQPWWDVGGNIGALGIRAIDAAIPRTPQELQAELVELKAAGTAYPALKLAKEIPIVKKGLGKLDEATIAFRTNLYNNIHASIFNPDGTIIKKGTQPLMSKGSSNVGGVSKRYNWRDIKGNKLWKSGKPDPKVTSKVDSILGMMDDWRLSHSDLERPMTGFVKHYGRKPTFWQDGKEWGIGWSRKKNNYEIFDVKARIDSRAKRLAGDKTSSNYSYKLRQIKEALVRDLNKQSKELPIEQWDIMIQNPGNAYKEHLIAIDSPFWKSKRGKNAGYLAGDSKNLKVLTDQNFKTLKDKVETHVHAKHKDLYVDYDPISQNIILRNLETGKALDTQIPGIGDPTKAKEYVADALAGKPMQSLETINPKTPPNVHRQIQKAYFADLDDITANAIIDRIKGDSWTKIRNTYGKDFSKRQLSLATDKYNKLTKSQVMAIMKAYNIGGKGKPGTY